MNIFKSSMRNKLLALLLLATIIPISIYTYITYTYTTNSVKHSVIEENKMLLTKGSQSFESYFNLVNKTTLVVYEVGKNNETLHNELKQEKSNLDRIHLNLYYIFNLLDYYVQINLYKLDTMQSFLFRNFLTYRDTTINSSCRGKDQRDIFIEPTHMTTDYSSQHLIQNPNKLVITFHRKLYDVPSDRLLGYISVDIDLEAIKSFCNDLYNPDYEKIYVIDKYSDTIIYSSQSDLTGSKANLPWYDTLKSTNDVSYIELQNEILLFEPISNNFMDWLIIKEVSNDYLYKSANTIANLIFIFEIILIILMIIVAITISFNFTGPIKELVKDMDKIKNGDLKADIEFKRQDEIGILAKNYQEMVDSLNNLIKYKYKLELANKENQIRVLQAQINPHFISNVLQAIGTEALEHDDMVIYNLILKLGNMMSYSMKTQSMLVPLKMELDYTITYLELQKQRFNESFDYSYSLDDNLANFLVPKMILQPIVENYFKHGFQKDDDSGYISINCYMENMYLIISVDNNGKCIDEKELNSLKELLNTSEISDDKIGLVNILNRLKLYYNNEASLNISNIQPKGVNIEISIKIEEWDKIESTDC